MLGFAVVDRPAESDVAAIWLTSRVALGRAGHTNAVCIRHDDPDRDAKLRSLTADRAVVLTDSLGSPLPLSKEPLKVAAIGLLIRETAEYQRRIIATVEARSRGKNLVQPDFPAVPVAPEVPKTADPAERALATANYLARAWSGWLVTEIHRRRRTVDPRTGTSPWIMPEDMSSPVIAELPAEFAAQVQSQPVF